MNFEDTPLSESGDDPGAATAPPVATPPPGRNAELAAARAIANAAAAAAAEIENALKTGHTEYESVTVLHPTVTEAEIEAEIAAITEMVTSAGGRMIEIERWGRRRLAYEIRKVHDAIYTHYRFEAPTSVLTDLDRRYRLNERLLRHLTLIAEGPVARFPEGHESDDYGPRRDGGRRDGPRERSHLGREAIIED